jgi:hypothetical protein
MSFSVVSILALLLLALSPAAAYTCLNTPRSALRCAFPACGRDDLVTVSCVCEEDGITSEPVDRFAFCTPCSDSLLTDFVFPSDQFATATAVCVGSAATAATVVAFTGVTVSPLSICQTAELLASSSPVPTSLFLSSDAPFDVTLTCRDVLLLQEGRTLTAGRRYWVALTLSVLVGGFGVDRCFLNRWASGVAKLLSLGGFGIWALLDVFLIATDRLTPVSGFYI